MSAFEELGVSPDIIRAIEEDNWLLPTPIQAEVIPYILTGSDVCAAAETGSGKTGAFGLPCIQIVHEALRDSIKDKPSTAGRPSRNLKFNINDKDSFVLVSADGLEARSEDDTRWNGIRFSQDVSGGKYQYEVLVLSDGLCRVGWSTSAANLALGMDDKGWGFGGTGKMCWNRRFEDYGRPFSRGDCIGVFLDREQCTIGFSVNGEYYGQAFRYNESALRSFPLFPHICGKSFHVRLRVGDDIQYPMAGFVPLGNIDPTHSTTAMSASLNVAGSIQRRPLCLILEPTRDLAQQTFNCIEHFAKYLSAPTIRCVLCVAGVDERGQKERIQNGVDIVVGTVQRVSMWMQKSELDLSRLRFLVLDEADELIKTDDRNLIPRIKATASRTSGNRTQILFFSATLHSPEVRASIEKLTEKAQWADLKGRPTLPETVHAVVLEVNPLDFPGEFKNPQIIPPTDGVHDRDNFNAAGRESSSRMIKFLKPQVAVSLANKLKMESCMVFCRTNVDCNNFEEYLVKLGGNRRFTGKVEGGKENPYSCVVLAGMRDQAERITSLKHFKDGDVRFLICTDVAARGIDIAELPYLIMMTLPDDPDQFIHRVGRVGRADRVGLAVCLVGTAEEKVWYHKCANRGKGCTNTRLVEQGGCTIWYNEPAYRKAVEDKLGHPLMVMDPRTYAVPGILTESGASIVENASGAIVGRRAQQFTKDATGTKETEEEKLAERAAGSMTLYGKPKSDAFGLETMKKIRDLVPAVERLMEMERMLQIQFSCRSLR